MERKGLFDLPGSVALFLGIIAPATRGLFGIIASFFQNSPPSGCTAPSGLSGQFYRAFN